MPPNLICLTGLPRSGSTLLCQLLAMHPDIACDGKSSPLCNTLMGIRRLNSDNQFFLSQLDRSFDTVYGRLTSAMQGFLRGWYHDCDKKAVVDKNRGWLHAVEMLLRLAPEAKFLVCIRDLGQIYGSIEAQHQRTILVDFIDHLADFDRMARADLLFSGDKAVGSPLIALQAVYDLPVEVQKRLYYVRFEDLMDRPVACMSHVFSWLDLPAYEINPENLPMGEVESDSHYHMKYLHKHKQRLEKPVLHAVPPRIQAKLESNFSWFYESYYPKVGVSKEVG